MHTIIRRRARGLIDAIVEEELEAALGAAPSARAGPECQGYRHGTRERTLMTSLGPTTFPRHDAWGRELRTLVSLRLSPGAAILETPRVLGHSPRTGQT